MQTIKLSKQGIKKEYVYTFPNSIDEIDENYISKITEHIAIADNYSLIALVRRQSLKALIMAYKGKKKSFETGVTPIFVKCGNTDNKFIKNIEVKTKLNIDKSGIELGSHVVTPTVLNIDKFCSMLDAYVDANLYNEIITNDEYNKLVCFLEFKLVPNCDIKAAYNSFDETEIEKSNSNYLVKIDCEPNNESGC